MQISPVSPLEGKGNNPNMLDRIKQLLSLHRSNPSETGNRVTPFIDGPAIFPEAEKMIKSADSAIQLEMYTLNHKEMVGLLCGKAEAGVKVQVVLDPSNKGDKTTDQLTASGVDVVFFPTNTKRRQIDHIKMLIVDGSSVLMGGMNWSNHSPVNHDADIKLEGPAVNYYRKAFEDAWTRSGGGELPKLPKAQKIPGQNARVLGISSDNFRSTEIKDSVMKNIDQAKKSIHLEAFILSDKNVIEGLVNAKRRGVDVKVLLDPTLVGTPFSSNDKTMARLKEEGIEAKWYAIDESTQQKLHAKWGVFDGEDMIVGSANLSFQGLNVNREIGAELQDKKTVSAFEKQFLEDWKSRSVDDMPKLEESLIADNPLILAC